MTLRNGQPWQEKEEGRRKTKRQEEFTKNLRPSLPQERRETVWADFVDSVDRLKAIRFGASM